MPPATFTPVRPLAYPTPALAAVLCAAAGSVLAQAPPGAPAPATRAPDTTVLLDVDVTVATPRLRRRPVGSAGATWDTDDLPGARSVAEVLDRGGVHVRHYGPGALASVSVRGGSAAQTLALWNGLPITNPSLGQIDWNLLAPATRQRFTLTRGGNASAWGSGAVAGTVHLQDLAPATAGLRAEAGVTTGAFGERGAAVAVVQGGARLSSSLQLDARGLANDFAYAPAPGLPERTQTNAAVAQTNLRTAVYFRPRPTDELALHYWRAEAEREIPPTAAQTRSAAVQTDAADRVSLRYRRRRKRYVLSATAGAFAESLDYRDSLAGVDSRSDFTVALGEATVTLPLKPGGTLLLGGTARHTRATVDDAYVGSPTETAASAMATYALRRGPLSLQADARYGRTTVQSLGFTPALGAEYRLAEGLLIRARVSRDFRAPTFNDRFYRPGGNPDLRPERGWGAEAGLDFRQNGWTATVTAYRRRLTDWILWARLPEQRFWAAYNLAAVTSEGLEPRLGYTLGTADAPVRLHVEGGYDLTRSVNEVAVELPRIGAGEQLRYVPRHSGFAHAALSVADVDLAYTHRWRGATQGVNAPVAASDTGDLTVSTRRTWRGQDVSAFLEIRNVLDADYRLIEYRPLPGRHLRAGLRVSLAWTPTRPTAS